MAYEPEPTDEVGTGTSAEMSETEVVTVDTFDEDEYDEYEDEGEEPRRDPLIRWMMIMSLMLVIVILGTTVSVVFFLLGMRGAPRTAAERSVYVMEIQAKEKPNDADAWFKLAYAYMNAKRFDDAQRAIDRGRKVKKTGAFALAEADLAKTAGHYEEALSRYNKAEKEIYADQARQVRENAKKQISMKPSPRLLLEVHIGRASVLQELGQDQKAVKDLTEAVELDPTDSFAWATLGDLHAKLGKSKDAKTAYENALKYIPDYQPAISGLEKLAKEQ